MREETEARALELLEEAYARPDAERGPWLARIRAESSELHSRLLTLLDADSHAQTFMPTEPRPHERGLPPAVPERIGPYRVGPAVGRGGMSAVHRAERADGQFEQAVAVKLMSPDLFSNGAARRFAFERQALARLHHPNIAQLYDAGVLPDGAGYIVMELVEGRPIDAFVADERLSQRTVVLLVRQVATAITHAHQSLLLHCDLKPGNVLVTSDRTAKLLDFGIGHAISGADDDWRGGGALTPDFAAPEQLRGEPPTTRTDVHGLGVLFYALLTREPPRALAQLAPTERAAAALATQPLRPSAAALTWAGPGEALWRQGLRGDLDAIVARAAHPDPERRYETAAALRDDIDRWLDGLPVRARPATWAYVVRRFVKRHRLAVAAAAAAVLTLIGGLAATSTLYYRTEGARAETQQRFDEVRSLSRFLLFDLYDRLERTPRSLRTRGRAAAEAQQYLDRLAVTAQAPFDLRVETALGYRRLARAQGQPGGRNLGQFDQAWRNYAEAERRLAVLAAERPDRRDIRVALAGVLLDQTWMAMAIRTDLPDAGRRLARAQPLIARLRRERPADRVAAALEMNRLIEWSDHAQWNGDYKTAARRAAAAVAFGDRLGIRTAEDHLLMARALQAVGEAAYFGGGQAKAALPAHAREAALMEEAKRRWPDDLDVDRQLTRSLYNHGVTLAELKDAQGLRILQRGRQAAERVIAFEPDDEQGLRQRRTIVRATAEALGWAGRHAEAEAMYRADVADRLANWRRTPADTSRLRDYATSVGALGLGLVEAGRRADACAALVEARGLFTLIEKRGQLTDFDRTQAIKNNRDAAKRVCPAEVARKL